MNDRLNEWSDMILDAANEFWNSIADFLPRILGALALVIVGAIVAKLAADVSKRLLLFFGADKINKNKTVNQTLKTTGIKLDVVPMVSRIVFWTVIIVFAMTAADVLELNAMRDTIRELLAYVPNVLAAAIVLTLTVAGARLVRTFVVTSLARLSVDYSLIVGSVSYAMVILFGVVLAAAQLGFDTTLLTTNLTVIIAGAVGALALAFGLGGKDLAANLLASLYTTNALAAGQKITVGDTTGTIKSVSRSAVVVTTKTGDVVVPNSRVLR